jgi:hypothetical protein
VEVGPFVTLKQKTFTRRVWVRWPTGFMLQSASSTKVFTAFFIRSPDSRFESNVTIGDTVRSGRIKCLGETFPFAPEITSGASVWISHGDTRRVTLRQRLSPDIVAKMNAQGMGAQLEFNLEDLRIPLFVPNQDLPAGHWKLGSYTLSVKRQF